MTPNCGILFLSISMLITFINVECSNILFLAAAASPSHFIWNRELAYGIVAKGHNITIISPDVEKTQLSNVHFVHLEKVYTALYNETHDVGLMNFVNGNSYVSVINYHLNSIGICKRVLASKGLDQILNYPDTFKFDLVLYDFTFGPCLLFLLHKFNYPPLIAVTAFNNPPFTQQLVGGHKFPTYLPHYACSFSSSMNFYQRLLNTAIVSFDNLYREYFTLPQMESLVRQRISMNFPALKDLERKSALLFVNSHPSLDYPESVPPNVIQVAGLQIATPKPLPKDIEDFIQAGKKGAVLLSFGSNLQSDMLSSNIHHMLIEAIEKIPEYNFIWKFESEISLKLPQNILIKSWLPQNDILAHPKMKAFISHSGLLSTQEATSHGVPIVAIPFFVDQHRNSFAIVNAGVGEQIMIHKTTAYEITATIRKVLETPSYSEKMKLRSKSFRDLPSRPLDTAVWWTEWILRNPKATHLRPPTLELGTFVTNGYDLIVVLIIVILLIIKCFQILFCFCKRLFIDKKTKLFKLNDKKYK